MSGVPKNVPLSHKNVLLVNKLTSFLDTVQKDNYLSRDFHGTKERFFFFGGGGEETDKQTDGPSKQ